MMACVRGMPEMSGVHFDVKRRDDHVGLRHSETMSLRLTLPDVRARGLCSIASGSRTLACTELSLGRLLGGGAGFVASQLHPERATANSLLTQVKPSHLQTATFFSQPNPSLFDSTRLTQRLT